MIAARPLRIYDPWELGVGNRPVGWERCEACGGGGKVASPKAGWPDSQDSVLAVKYESRVCEWCGGHGSLKAACLHGLGLAIRGVTHPLDGDWHMRRCEDCAHPMTEGTWVNPDHPRSGSPILDDVAIAELLTKPYHTFHGWAERHGAVHYSPCDKFCHHSGPGRAPRWGEMVEYNELINNVGITPGFEASWRPVDVRTLGHPFDLRIERIALLCSRCYGTRDAALRAHATANREATP